MAIAEGLPIDNMSKSHCEKRMEWDLNSTSASVCSKTTFYRQVCIRCKDVAVMTYTITTSTQRCYYYSSYRYGCLAVFSNTITVVLIKLIISTFDSSRWLLSFNFPLPIAQKSLYLRIILDFIECNGRDVQSDCIFLRCVLNVWEVDIISQEIYKSIPSHDFLF
jgi:hypothetical protein